MVFLSNLKLPFCVEAYSLSGTFARASYSPSSPEFGNISSKMRQKRLKGGLVSFRVIQKLLVKMVLLILAFAARLPIPGEAFTHEPSTQNKPIDLHGSSDYPDSPPGSKIVISGVKTRVPLSGGASFGDELDSHHTVLAESTPRSFIKRREYLKVGEILLIVLPFLFALVAFAVVNRFISPARRPSRPLDGKTPESEPVSDSLREFFCHCGVRLGDW